MKKVDALTAKVVRETSKPGLYSDGFGLYLQVAKGGSKSWIFRYMMGGKSRKMGLGPIHTIPITLARKRAAEARLLVYDGIDPINHRKMKRTTP